MDDELVNQAKQIFPNANDDAIRQGLSIMQDSHAQGLARTPTMEDINDQPYVMAPKLQPLDPANDTPNVQPPQQVRPPQQMQVNPIEPKMEPEPSALTEIPGQSNQIDGPPSPTQAEMTRSMAMAAGDPAEMQKWKEKYQDAIHKNVGDYILDFLPLLGPQAAQVSGALQGIKGRKAEIADRNIQRGLEAQKLIQGQDQFNQEQGIREREQKIKDYEFKLKNGIDFPDVAKAHMIDAMEQRNPELFKDPNKKAALLATSYPIVKQLAEQSLPSEQLASTNARAQEAHAENMKNAELTRQQQMNIHQENMAQQSGIHQDNLNAKIDEKEQKRQEKLQGTEAIHRNFNAAADEAIAAIKEHGTADFTGAHNKNLEGLYHEMATGMAQVKSTEGGMPRPAMIDLERRSLPAISHNPTYTSNDAIKEIENARKIFNTSYKNAYGARNIETPGGGNNKNTQTKTLAVPDHIKNLSDDELIQKATSLGIK